MIANATGSRLLLCLVSGVLSCAVLLAGESALREEDRFESQVRPVLVEKCFRCHGEEKQRAGLRLDSRAALLEGGDSGPAVAPGDDSKSLLIRVLRHEGDIRMPPKEKLPDETLAAIQAWVRAGATWPGTEEVRTGPSHRPDADELRRIHWAFRPIGNPPIPEVEDASWISTSPDAFILAKLEEHGLQPAARADARTLIRRVTYDLTGLPPDPAAVEAFVADPSDEAWAHRVDELLDSPRYGECWGRHWLDVARYADTKGYVFQEERRFPYSYTYRDWVIRSLNEDLPYDRFLREQIAADLLVEDGETRSLAALGFLTLGRRFLNNPHDIIDDRIDVVSRGTMALTVSCARCHDHKYDPIPTADYYSLYGVFASSEEPGERPLLGEPERTPEFLAFEEELRKREAAVKAFLEQKRVELFEEESSSVPLEDVRRRLDRAGRNRLNELQKKVDVWKVTGKGAPPRAMSLVEKPTPHDPVVFIRGNPGRRGERVPRQFLELLSRERKPFEEGSGRRELAEAIASEENPLTARVLVNRVWMHHFGEGIVRTPGDFGTRSDPPTHPELLDHLATRFIEGGWSLKKLHRLILLSSTYRQASDSRDVADRLDPENRLLGRMNRRRLGFEALRDSLLQVAGRLDLTPGGPSVDILSEPFSTRRTVYGFIDRQNLPGLFRTFDFASPDATRSRRHTTTVPQQALFLMNSPFVIEQARHVAARDEVATADGPEARVRALYRIVLARQPGTEEVTRAVAYLGAAEAGKAEGPAGLEAFAQVLLLSNEFFYLD